MPSERVPRRMARWRRHPNGGAVAIIAVPKLEAPGLLRQGWVKIDGERAVIDGIDQQEPHNMALRIKFDRPYPHPHP